MNEDFVRQFKKQPDSQLVEKIHLRLEKKGRAQTIKRYSMLSGLTLMFMFGMLMAFSSRVRADVISLFEKIGGLEYEVTSNYPGGPDEEVIIVDSEYLSLDDARSRFPSPIQLPTYVPQGYERRTDVELYDLTNGISPSLRIIWKSKELSERIDLDITHCLSSFTFCGMMVGAEALEEITLNGKPAVLIRGAWNYDTKEYDLSQNIVIQWRYDENTVYALSAWKQNLLDELIKIAESIP